METNVNVSNPFGELSQLVLQVVDATLAARLDWPELAPPDCQVDLVVAQPELLLRIAQSEGPDDLVRLGTFPPVQDGSSLTFKYFPVRVRNSWAIIHGRGESYRLGPSSAG